jgi:hypothetical protein
MVGARDTRSDTRRPSLTTLSVMRRLALIALLLLAGCKSGSTPGHTAASPTVASRSSPSDGSSPVAVPAAPSFRSVCGGFKTFYYVMSAHPPSQDWNRLIDLATAVDQAPGSVKLHRLADGLLAYVTTQSFPHDGNLAGQPVQDLADACF